MNSATIRTARKATCRARPLCWTTCAERSSVSPIVCAAGGAVKRSTAPPSAVGGGVTPESPAGVSSRPVRSSVIGRRSDAAGRRLGRDQSRLAERHGQRPERDLARVHRQLAALDGVREPVEAPRRRPELLHLRAEAVVAGAVARALEPVVLGAEVRLAAQ